MQINGFVGDDAVTDAHETPSRHPLVTVLAVLVFAECALVCAATIYLVLEIIVATPASYASAVALTVIVAIAAIWLAVIGVNVLRGRAWTRGAALVWQVLQIAVAVGCFQGAFARPDLGWVLLIPSIAVILLLFSRPVVAAISNRS
jgi:hypothetical protein